MNKRKVSSGFIILLFLYGLVACKNGKSQKSITENPSSASQWTIEQANDWYDQYPFLAGGNYVPASAINQLEMWQEETFDPQQIDFELRHASEIGMNTMRVFLHDLAWKQDKEGFLTRVDRFLEIADKHGIKPMIVFFDGVWNPYPKVGKQPEPTPRVHNSGWVQSPGREILEDSAKQDELKTYVQSVISRYKNDERILIWDMFNEPDNANGGNFGGGSKAPDLPRKEKLDRALELLKKSFVWAREIGPSQPLTVGVWGKATWLEEPDAIEKFSLENSDIISFHSYQGPEETERMVEGLKRYNRPIMCTEYMARSAGSTFQGILPMFHKNRVAAYNWGLFDGKSQTIYPWKSWKEKFIAEPEPWFHDVFRKDGTPYDKEETRLIKKLTAVPYTTLSKVPEVAEVDSRETIEMGLKSHDKALFIKTGWIRDPFINIGPDGDFYLTGTTPLNEKELVRTDPYNIGLNNISCVGWKAYVWKSKDLIDWEPVENAYSLKDGIWDDIKPERFAEVEERQWRLWAPELHWLGDRWAITHTSPTPVRASNLSLSNGLEPVGPWENPMGENLGHKHDPSLFKDYDGSWWLVWGATQIARLKSGFSGFEGKPIKIGPSGQMKRMGHEGCLIKKINGKYVLFGTGWSTGIGRRGTYNLYYAVADKITGPYGERKFVGRFLGHGTPFKNKDGKWWCTAFYNANVPPFEAEGIETKNLIFTAASINQRGTTIVPLDVYTTDSGELIIRAKDPAYGTPGPDEAQKFEL
ncbi:family 43 glycosylhydrolase [Seonamhaeicola sp.]|uniref:family 43 glycosylhydrolase n=1 Tax=Seonamhaeicola sp. TaxID=1912245 RepID=UPI002629FD1E|nr:family 43 glycosylhydrolase [Seonamhaeicola sp.]